MCCRCYSCGLCCRLLSAGSGSGIGVGTCAGAGGVGVVCG